MVRGASWLVLGWCGGGEDMAGFASGFERGVKDV